MTDFSGVIKRLETERDRIDAAITALRGLVLSTPVAKHKRKTMSAAARKRIGAAQRARWARVKAERKAKVRK